MKDFIEKLYANENFPIYLGLIIAILLVAFLVVFILGKKDQKKIEKTKVLEKINADAFKEVSTPVDPVVASPVQEVVAPVNNNEIIVQNENIDNQNAMNVPPVMPAQPINNVNNTIEENSISQAVPVQNASDVAVNNENKTINPVENFSSLANSIEEELRKLEELEKQSSLKQNNIINEIAIDNIPEKKTEVPKSNINVFSSVYTPVKNNEDVELPKLK